MKPKPTIWPFPTGVKGSPWQDGFEAYANGKIALECPHQGSAGAAWLLGFEAAKKTGSPAFFKLRRAEPMTELEPRQCFCRGPQCGQPKCPCEMRRLGIYQRDGRWIQPAGQEIDLGPTPSKSLRDMMIKGIPNG